MSSLSIARDRDANAVRRILEALPDWFGDPASIDDYVADAANPAFASYLASIDDSVVGIALVNRHFPQSAELHLIAVAPDSRGHGVGSALVERVRHDLRADGCRMLSVHTVGPSFDHEPYAKTRAFYEAAGFVPLEEHTGLGWDGPMLILVSAL